MPLIGHFYREYSFFGRIDILLGGFEGVSDHGNPIQSNSGEEIYPGTPGVVGREEASEL